MRRASSFNPLVALLPSRYRKVARVIIVLLLAAVGGGGSLFLQGKVVKVADGDTLTLLEGATTRTVRLYGIDAPERGQAFGEAAGEFARQRALFQPIAVEVFETDQYGRQVALVRLPDGSVLNEELIQNGLAMVYRHYCKEAFCQRWLALEDEARMARRGLWEQKKPTPPWVWRAKNKSRR